MMENSEMISFYASHHADSVKTECFCVIAIKGKESGSYSQKEWFNLKTASFEKLEGGYPTEVIVTAPKWILEKKGIIDLITKK